MSRARPPSSIRDPPPQTLGRQSSSEMGRAKDAAAKAAVKKAKQTLKELKVAETKVEAQQAAAKAKRDAQTKALKDRLERSQKEAQNKLDALSAQIVAEEAHISELAGSKAARKAEDRLAKLQKEEVALVSEKDRRSESGHTALNAKLDPHEHKLKTNMEQIRSNIERNQLVVQNGGAVDAAPAAGDGQQQQQSQEPSRASKRKAGKAIKRLAILQQRRLKVRTLARLPLPLVFSSLTLRARRC